MRITLRVTLDVDEDEYPHWEYDEFPLEYLADDVANLLNESITFQVAAIKSIKGEHLI